MTATLEKNTATLDKRETIGNNRGNSSAPDDERENRPLGLTTSISSATVSAQSVSESHAEKRRKRNAAREWRRHNGHFTAKECGVRFVREELLYDPKSAEKVLPTRYPITESDVTLHRAEMRKSITTDKPERTTTLEGIYHWLAEYAKLTPEQKADAEKMAGRTAKDSEGEVKP